MLLEFLVCMVIHDVIHMGPTLMMFIIILLLSKFCDSIIL